MQSGPTLELDSAVLSGLRAGDRGAFEDFYRTFGDRVYRVCRSMLGQDSDAEDATQEVFLKVLERAHQFAERSRFSTWLHRIAVNQCLHRIEKEQRRRADALHESLVDDSPSPVKRSEEQEAKLQVDKLLERIPPDQRSVLVLREIEGLSYADIAEVLGIPVGTVMSRLARARERLAALVSAQREERSSRCAP